MVQLFEWYVTEASSSSKIVKIDYGSKVTALFLFPRWRSTPSWISYKCHIGQFCPKIRHRSFVYIKYDKNRLNGSKVTVLFLFPRWRSPPSWILSKCHLAKFCRIIRHWSFILVKYGENRLNGSKVIALFLYSRWRSPPSWILLYSRICPLNCFRFVNSN